MKAYVRLSGETAEPPAALDGRAAADLEVAEQCGASRSSRTCAMGSGSPTRSRPLGRSSRHRLAVVGHPVARPETLLELCETTEGYHAFIYPFEGQLVHEGLASLLSLRLQRRHAGTFALSANDYGIELLSAEPYPFVDLLDAGRLHRRAPVRRRHGEHQRQASWRGGSSGASRAWRGWSSTAIPAAASPTASSRRAPG